MSADEASRALRKGQSVVPQKKVGRPHDPDSLRNRKPWEALGISRTTWYERRKEGTLTEVMEPVSSEQQAAPPSSASERLVDRTGFRVGDVVDLNAAAALQSAIADLCQDKPLSMIALVLMNEIANNVLLSRPTIGKAHRAVDLICSQIRDLLETKIKQYPEWLDDGTSEDSRT